MAYLFYERKESGVEVVARLDGDTFSGDDAEFIESLLRESGWKGAQDDPRLILHGSRLWAALEDEPAEDI